MLNNLLYLIDTQSINLVVTLFIMTVNNTGNVVLRFVSELGNLGDLENFFSEDAYVAVKEVEYQNENSEFVKSLLPNYAKTLTVVATVIDEEKNSDLRPFGISILKNNMILKKPKRLPIKNNEFVVLATIKASSVKASNNVATVIIGDKNSCTYFEFHTTSDSKRFENSDIIKEKNIELMNLEAIKESKKSDYGNTIKYKRKSFDEKWRLVVLANIDEYYIDSNACLIPRIDGLWYSEYIEGISFPYWIVGENCNKNEWVEFLSNPNNFPINIENFLKVS